MSPAPKLALAPTAAPEPSQEELLIAYLEARIEDEQRNRCIEAAFWRGEVRDAVRQGELVAEGWWRKLKRLRAQLDERQDRATRKGDGAVRAVDVARAIRVHLNAGASQKDAELSVAEELGISDRAVRRRLREFRIYVESNW